MRRGQVSIVTVLSVSLVWASSAAALTAAEKCQAAKLKAANPEQRVQAFEDLRTACGAASVGRNGDTYRFAPSGQTASCRFSAGASG